MSWRPFQLCELALALLLGTADVWAMGPRLSIPDAQLWFTTPHAGVAAADLSGITPALIEREWAQLATPQAQAQRVCHRDESLSSDCRAPQNLSLLLQLNLRAADLWSRIVACNGGPAGAEAARRYYFGGQRLCDDLAMNGGLVAELKTLARNFQDFLVTSPFRQESAVIHAGLPALHPLLAEFATEAVAATLYLVQKRYWSSLRGTYTFPAGKFELTVEMIACEYGPPHVKKSYDLCIRDEQQTENYWPRTYLNAIRILTAPTANSRDCSRYGLWPNAALIGSSSISLTQQSLISSERGDSYRIPVSAPNPAMPSCWVGSEEIIHRMSSNWSTLDASGDDVVIQHTNFVANVLAEYSRIREAWLN